VAVFGVDVSVHCRLILLSLVGIVLIVVEVFCSKALLLIQQNSLYNAVRGVGWVNYRLNLKVQIDWPIF
jgi:hypothetical protein